MTLVSHDNSIYPSFYSLLILQGDSNNKSQDDRGLIEWEEFEIAGEEHVNTSKTSHNGTTYYVLLEFSMSNDSQFVTLQIRIHSLRFLIVKNLVILVTCLMT